MLHFKSPPEQAEAAEKVERHRAKSPNTKQKVPKQKQPYDSMTATEK